MSVLVVCLLSLGCGDEQAGQEPILQPIDAASVAVNETLRIDLAVSNPDGLALTFGLESPPLPGFDGVTQLSGTPAGGLFLWTPLVSHVGQHELIFSLTSERGRSTRAVVVDVLASPSSAPVFLRPGAGGTFDLESEPCVRFDIEVRDDDSESVEIRAAAALPDSATITETGPKQAQFDWCPAADQIDASERWTIELAADDGEHTETLHSYVVVLRVPPKEGCPGAPPTIEILAPTAGGEVRSAAGFAVEVSVSDDTGLRDDPLLYYTTVEPADLGRPDLTSFELTPFSRTGSTWTARIPSLGLESDERRRIWAVASATDNDDPSGTTCDHRAETAVHSFVAVGSGSANLATCQACDRSSDCASGLCVSGAGGGVCLDPCSANACIDGNCVDASATEGVATRACGPVSTLCSGDGPDACVEDDGEEDDDIANARPLTDSVAGQICAFDSDVYAIELTRARQLATATLRFEHARGDLDIDLVDADGTLLDRSEGVEDVEVVSAVSEGPETIYAVVMGFLEEQNSYTLEVVVDDAPCEDDGNEPDDVPGDATPYPGDVMDGTICPDDEDWISFEVSEPSAVEIIVAFDWELADLDAELFGPSGERIDFSIESDSDESIVRDLLVRGRYTLRIYGFLGTSTEYLVEIDLMPLDDECVSDEYCAVEDVCDTGVCLTGACASDSDCPPDYHCPLEDPGPSVGFCGAPCAVNGDCRPGDACKWFVGGRACGDSGSGLNGAACRSFASCGGQRTCYGWDGGYCARVGCTSSGDCETGTHCIMDGDTGVCALDCFDSDDICRIAEGYRCDLVRDTEDQLEFVCLGS